MPDHVQSGMRRGMDFDAAANFYDACDHHEYGDACDHPRFSDAFPAVPSEWRRQEMDEICGIALCRFGSLHPVKCDAKAWRAGVDAAFDAELSLLFQEIDNDHIGRISDFIFGFYLHRHVLWRMGSDSVGRGILFRTESGNKTESL